MSTTAGSPPPPPSGPPLQARLPAAVPPRFTPPPRSAVTAIRVVGTVVAALVIAGTTVTVVARFFHQERVETAVYSQPLTGLVVRATTGDVRVSTGAPGSPVVVRRHFAWSFGTASSKETITGGRLDVEAQCLGPFTLGDCSVDYEISTPPGIVLTLDNHTGDIDVNGPTADVTASSHTGDVTILDAHSAHTDITTSTGDLEVRFAVPPQGVRAEASTGDVVVVVPADGTGYAVRTSTSTGDATVSVPIDSTSNRQIEARTSTGDIEVRQAS